MNARISFTLRKERAHVAPTASFRLRLVELRSAFSFVMLVTTLTGASQVATITVNPEADAFLRSAAPNGNYGGAGAIAVSGSAAVNATNQQNGLFDSLIRFPISNVIASLDASLGTHDWLVRRATLQLTEMGSPPSPIFNRGVGAFEIRRIAANAWTEGTGIPVTPTTNGVVWNDLPSLLNSAADVSLGQFNNNGVDGVLAFDLALKESFVSAVRSGSALTLYLTAASPQIGFTADSRSFVLSNDFPALTIEAAANPHPQIDSVQLLGPALIVNFSVVSNWTYTLQSVGSLTAPESGTWSNLLTVPAQPSPTNVVYSEPATNRQKFYRLEVH